MGIIESPVHLACVSVAKLADRRAPARVVECGRRRNFPSLLFSGHFQVGDGSLL
jgi:hypothetical protein